MSYFGGRYFGKGGDDAQERHYQKLMAVAQENGVLSRQNQGIMPEGLKSAFFRVADLLMRPNFAIAGAVDVLQGTGRADETVGGRVFRELLSGVGGLKGDKETFGEILEQRGVGEGGRLSDVIGETFLSRHGFDPTARGTVALGLDIFTDPLTYLTVGAGSAVKVVGRGGERFLSKAGREMATKMYTESLQKVASRWVDDAAKLSLGELEQVAIQGYKKRGLYKSLGESADETIRRALKRKHFDQPIIDAIEAGATGLTAPRRAVLFAGRSLGSTEGLEAPLRALHASLTGALGSTEIGADLLKNTGKIIDSVDKLFNRVPRLARKVPGFKHIEAVRHSLHQSSSLRAEDELRTVFGKWLSHTKGDDWAVLTRALDNPEKYGQAWLETATQKIGMGADEATAIFEDLRSRYKLMAASETATNLLDNVVPNYVPHMLTKVDDDAILAPFRTGSKFAGADVGRFNKQRIAENFDELEAIQAQLGKDLGIVYDPAKLFKARFEAHLKGMADVEFQNNLLRMFAVGSDVPIKDAIRAILPHATDYLKSVGKEITEHELSVVGEMLGRVPEVYGRGWAQHSTIELIEKEFARLPESQAIERIGKELGLEASELAQIRASKEIQKYFKLARQTDLNRRRAGVFDLMERRAAVLDEAAPFTVLNKMLRKGISIAERSTTPQIQKATAALDDMMKASKGIDADLRGPMRGLIAKQQAILKEAKDAFTEAKITPRKKMLAKVRQIQDDYRAVTKEINEEIRAIRAEQSVNLDDLEHGREVLSRILSREKELGVKTAASRKALSGLRKQRAMRGLDDPERFTKSGKLRKAAVLDDDIRKLMGLSPEARASFMFETLIRTHGPADLMRVLDRYEGVFDSIAPEHLAALRKAMDNRFQVQGLRYAGQPYVEYGLTKGPGKGTWLLPKGVAEDLERFKGVWQDAPEVGALLRQFDRLTNTFKFWVTGPFPAFHVRNGYSNIFASMVDIGLAALDPRRHAEAIRIMLGHDGTIVTDLGQRVTFNEMRQEMKALDVEISRATLADIGNEGTAAIGQRLFTPRQKAGRLEREVVSSTLIENEARALHYYVLRRRGMSPEDAAAQMKSFLFDYSDLSEFERNVMRRIIPFYSWQSKNIRRQVQNIASRPGKLGAQVKLFDRDRGPDNDMLPEYLRGDLKIDLQRRPGKKAAFITNIDLPISNVDILWKGSLGKTLRENVTMMNPLLKTPLELAFNMDTFSGRPIKGSQWIGQMGPALDRSLPGWAKDYFELRKVTMPNGEAVYRANGLRIYLTFKSMFVGRLVNTGVTVESLAHDFGKGGKPNYAGLLKLMTGLQFREYSFDEAERAEIGNKVERLEQLMLDKGLASEFTKVFVPKGQSVPVR